MKVFPGNNKYATSPLHELRVRDGDRSMSLRRLGLRKYTESESIGEERDKFRFAQPTIGKSRDISVLIQKHTCDIFVFVNMVPSSTVAFLGLKNLFINGCLDKKLAKCHQNWIRMGVLQQQITNVSVETRKALKK